jgi:hypothetical protein
MATLAEEVAIVMTTIECFDVECDNANYTDIDTVWEIFDDIRARLRPHLSVEQRACIHAEKEKTRRELLGE